MASFEEIVICIFNLVVIRFGGEVCVFMCVLFVAKKNFCEPD